MHQSNFLENMIQFNNKTKPKKKLDKEKNEMVLIGQVLFMKVDNLLITLSEVEYFQ